MTSHDESNNFQSENVTITSIEFCVTEHIGNYSHCGNIGFSQSKSLLTLLMNKQQVTTNKEILPCLSGIA